MTAAAKALAAVITIALKNQLDFIYHLFVKVDLVLTMPYLPATG